MKKMMSKKLARLETARRRRIAQGKGREGDSHSAVFWDRKYKELRRYASEKGIEFPFTSQREFISDWMAISQESDNKSGEVLKEMKYGLQYATRYKVALAEKRALIDAGVPEDDLPSLRNLKTMSTREFAERNKDTLMARYNELKKTMSASDAADALSAEWFGSE